MSDINQENGLAVVDEIVQHRGDAIFVKANTSKPDDNKKLVEETVRVYHQLDVAVNNAGISGPLAATGEYPIDGWEKVIEINLSGVFYGMRYQIPAMSKGGSIINVSSVLGQVAQKFTPAYIAAKHGVVGLTKAAALDHATQGIRVNAVGPGYIGTPLISEMDDDTRAGIAALHAVGRLGQAEEVAALILWLASRKASFATGAYYPIDGGYLAK